MIAAMLLAALICFTDVTMQMDVFDGYVRQDGVSLGCGAPCFGFDYAGCTDESLNTGDFNNDCCAPLDDWRARGCVCVEPTGRTVDPLMPCFDADGGSPVGEPLPGWMQWYVLKPGLGQSRICL